jgi:metal-responsive CopG/Arc/MetJ family transcriptional regulator
MSLFLRGQNMSKAAYAVKLDKGLLEDLKDFCEEKGYKQSSFVEKALREQMEREELKEDIFDLVSLRSQEKLARPLKEYHRSRK